MPSRTSPTDSTVGFDARKPERKKSRIYSQLGIRAQIYYLVLERGKILSPWGLRPLAE